MLSLLATLAAASSPVVPVSFPAKKFDIDMRVSCASGVTQPHLVSEEGSPVTVTVGPTDGQGWSVKVTPTRLDSRVKLALDIQVWTVAADGRRVRRATSDIVLPAGAPARVVIPGGDGAFALEAEISASPVAAPAA